jgi:uncharacterized protein YjiS (DUF1127 family)
MNHLTNTQLIRTTKVFAVLTLAERLVNQAARIVQRIEDRRALRALQSFSDYALKDIGITRGDVEREAMRPIFWRNEP